jgi:membrane-associated phospholipid phosphatase
LLWKSFSYIDTKLIRQPGIENRSALLLIALDGPARVYLGDHRASDVIGGYLFGSGWLALWFRISLLLRGKHILASS